MASAAAAYSTNQLQLRVAGLTRELEASKIQLAAVQRNYTTVAKLLHDRLQLLEEASQQLVAERSDAEQLKTQLEATTSRAAAAEEQLKHGSHLPDEMSKLQLEASALRAGREEDYQQRLALQEQLSRLKQDLYAAANNKQQLSEQLQEQLSLNNAANTTISTLRQQLNDEKAEGRTTASQLQALRDVLARSTALQQDMEKQAAALKARTKAAEEAAAAEQASCKQLHQDLQNAKGGQANSALRLLDLQTSQQLLDEKLTKATEALALEQAARAQADTQVLSLHEQISEMQHRAEAAEAATAAAAVHYSQAQHETAVAQAAQYTAEEARRTADAATKLVTQRLAEAQLQAANDRAIAEATQRELRDRLADYDAQLQLQRQQEQGWRFRQLEVMTRALAALEHLQARVEAVGAAAGAYDKAAQQQHDQQQGSSDELLSTLDNWCACAEELEGVGGRINAALVHVAQQWAAKQQKLRSTDKGLQVLQKQVEQLEQQLSIASVMERKLQQELADVQGTREHDQAEAKHELEQAAATLAAAQAAAAGAEVSSAQQQAAVAQLETKLASVDSELVALRYKAAAKDSEVAAMAGNVKAATRRMQRLACAASDMVGMLERVGALQPQDVAALLAQLGVIMGRSTSGTPSRPSTPAPTAGAAGSSAAAGSDGSSGTAAVAPDAGGSKQLLDGLGCLQQQMQVLVRSTQQLAEQYPKLLASWQDSEREVENVAKKLIHVEESLASNYTCLVCMKVFDHPVAVVPCGHNYCRSCFVSTLASTCSECSSVETASCIPAPGLEQLCAKYEYRLLTLKGLQGLLAQRQLHKIQLPAT